MLGNGIFVMKGDQYADRYIAAYCERAAVMVKKKPFDVRPIKSVYRLATKPLDNIYFVFDIDKLVEDKEAYLKSVKPFARRIVQDWKYNEYLNKAKLGRDEETIYAYCFARLVVARARRGQRYIGRGRKFRQCWWL